MDASLLRELDRRAHDGLAVTLLWNPETNEVSVQVRDERGGAEFRVVVPAAFALDAFRHPYAYADASLPLARRAVEPAVAE
jgi:hypothetical protein